MNTSRQINPAQMNTARSAGILGDAAQGDSLYNATQSLLTALSNSPGYPSSISCGDTTVAAAASAFQSAYNAAPAIANTVSPSTGAYDSGTQVALQASINAYQALSPPVSFTSGSAPPPCSVGGGARKVKASPVVSTLPVVSTTYEFPETPAQVSPPPAPSPTPPSPPTHPIVQALLPPAPPALPAPPASPVSATFVAPPPVYEVQEEYVVQGGESPEIISRRLGVPFHELIRANPHKPRVHVGRGVYTWRDLKHGERLRVPAHRPRGRGRLGDVGVGLVQGDALYNAAQLLLTALSNSPSVSCGDANIAGAAGSFQRAYNAERPSVWSDAHGTYVKEGTVPFTVTYDEVTAKALQNTINAYATLSPPVSFTSGSAPPACTVPSHRVSTSAPSAAQALASVNPCDQSNVGLVWAFQQSVGQDPDGKYGADAARALTALVPGAPAGCHPRPAWWAPHGEKNYPDGISRPRLRRYVPPPAPPPVAVVQPTAPPPVVVVQPPPPPSPQAVVAPQGLVPPEKKKEGISTGAIVAGSIGAAALVGIIAAVASTSSKSTARLRRLRAREREEGDRLVVQSGAFTISRKVDAGELAMQSARSLVVRTGCLLFGVEATEMDCLVVGSHASAPLTLYQRYTFELGRPSARELVHHVLLVRYLSQVLSAIVQSISITMIDIFGRFTEKVSMQKDRRSLAGGVGWCSAACCIPGVLASCTASSGAPVPSRHISEVDVIDESEHSLRQRNPSSAFDRRRFNGCTNSSTAIAIALSAALVTEFSGTPGTCRLTSKRSATFDAIVVQIHCSTPSMSESRAPVVDATWGRFNGGYHAA